MRIFPLVLFSAFLATEAFAQTPQIARADILDYGIYTAETVQSVPDSDSPTGQRKISTDIRFIERTTTVQGRVGLRFGVRWNIVGTPDGATVAIKRVFRFPSAGIRNPDTGTITYIDQDIQDRVVGTPILQGYSLDNPWEIVPGTWTFEIWHGDRKLAAQSFTVVKP